MTGRATRRKLRPTLAPQRLRKETRLTRDGVVEPHQHGPRPRVALAGYGRERPGQFRAADQGADPDIGGQQHAKKPRNGWESVMA